MGAIQNAVNQTLATGAAAALAANQTEGTENRKLGEFWENKTEKKLNETFEDEIKPLREDVDTKTAEFDAANSAKESYSGDKRKKGYRGLKAQALDAERNLQGAKDALENLKVLQELRAEITKGILEKFKIKASSLLGSADYAKKSKENYLNSYLSTEQATDNLIGNKTKGAINNVK